jgi:hypothetical protein
LSATVLDPSVPGETSVAALGLVETGMIEPLLTDETVVCNMDDVASRVVPFLVVVVDVEVVEVDVVDVVVVDVVLVEVVVVVVHFEHVHAREPSKTSLLAPNLQQDWVCRL